MSRVKEMLQTKKLLIIVIRQMSDRRQLFTPEVLCSAENQIKCIEKMKAASKYTTLKRTRELTKYAAVLVPLVPSDENSDELSVLYTLRSNKMRRHIRQVSFPGGIRDESDASFADCALRETEEEIGIKASQVSVWGETNLFRPISGPAIMPVIAQIKDYRSDQLKLNPDEVERVFTVPISELCDNKRHTQFRALRRSDNSIGSGYSVPVFVIGGNPIWGITAIITHLFLCSLLPDGFYKSQIPYISKYKQT